MIATDGTNAWTVTGANAGTVGGTTTFSNMETLTGGSGTDTLTGLATANAFSITGPNAVTTSGMNMTSVEALVGGAAADTFTLATLVTTFNGTLNGGAGTDALVATDGTNAWASTGANQGTLNATTTFTTMETLTGGSGTDTLTGQNAANAWAIPAANEVTLDGMAMTSVEALAGGTLADTFTLATLVTTFNGSIAGNGGTDELVATDGTNAWAISAANIPSFWAATARR